MSRFRLQVIRWVSGALAGACVVTVLVAHPRGGAAVALLFGMLILGAPGALITLHLYDTRR